MKLAVASVIVAIITYLSKKLSEKFTLRCELFNDLQEFLSEQKINIRTEKCSMSHLLKNAKPTIKCLYGYDNSIDETKYITLLTNEEHDKIYSYIKRIGKSDSLTEEEQITSMQEWVAEKIECATVERNTKVPLYIKLGTMAGIALVILII